MACQSGMRALGVVLADPSGKPGPQLRAGLERVQKDAFVFQAAPEPLDEHVVHPPAATIHGDAHARVLQDVGETGRGELAALDALLFVKRQSGSG